MVSSLHCVISGKVQDVSFPAWVQETAKNMSVVGWVRYLHDGRVEVLAQGVPENLKEFEKRLASGKGEVEKIECKTIEYDKSYDSFELRV